MTDPIICVHQGRSTWQGPASAAPRMEDRRMTHDPEAAERLATMLAQSASLLDQDYSRVVLCQAWGEAAALIRAQAAEIARLREVVQRRCPLCAGTGLRPVSGGVVDEGADFIECDHGIPRAALAQTEDGA